MKKMISKKNIGCLLLMGVAVGLIAPVAASATTLNCTLGCTSGEIDGAFFTTQEFDPAGTGYIAPFIRLSDSKSTSLTGPPHDGFESGVNGGNDLEEKDTFIHNWNRILAVTSDMIFNSNGKDYMVFYLDANEVASPTGQYIDMTNLRLYIGPDNQYTHASNPSDGTNLVWGMDEAEDSIVNLDYDYIGGGSGWGDLNVWIPLGNTGAGASKVGQNFFLYSAFGYADNVPDDGFEEWTVAGTGVRPPDEVPEPATMLLFGAGLAGLAGAHRRMKK